MLNFDIAKMETPPKTSNQPFTEVLKTNACGKAILVGEHGVVYGSRAIAFPMPNIRIRLTAKEISTTEPHNHIDPIEKTIQKIFLQCCSILKKTSPRIQITSSCAIPIGAGLGASAALCVAVVRLASGLLNIHLTADKTAYVANELEKSFHGNPSGLDTAVVSHESAILFEKNSENKNCPMPFADSFILISSGLTASTSKMVELAKPFFRGEAGRHLIRQFDETTMATYQLLQQGGPLSDMASHIKRADQLLRDIKVVPTKMIELIDFCIRSGATAAKTTGAGGGGFILCVVPKAKQTSFIKNLDERSIHYLRPLGSIHHKEDCSL